MSKNLKNTKTNANAKTLFSDDGEARQKHARDLVEHDALIVVAAEPARAFAADPDAHGR